MVRQRSTHILFFTLISVAAVWVPMSRTGLNVVTETYQFGAQQFYHHADPYQLPIPRGDRFEYSPLFASLYGAFGFLSPSLQSLLWAAANALLFWTGLFVWVKFPVSTSYRIVSYVYWVVASMELNISLLYQQVNASLIGLVLLGLHFFAIQKNRASALLLAVATNLKLIPALFAFPLLIHFRRKFPLWFLAGTLGCLLIPALWVGWSSNIELHFKWWQRVSETLVLYRDDQMDIQTVCMRNGLPLVGTIIRYVVLFFGLALVGLGALRQQIDGLWFSVGITTLLLASPRTESPGFVMMAPCYYFLALAIQEHSTKFRKSLLAILAITAFITTVSYTDLSPQWIQAHLPHLNAHKTLGVLALWILSVGFSLSLWKHAFFKK